MLTDIQRKMLRILYNYSIGRRRMPSIHELTIKTGRKEAGVLDALTGLRDAGYIEWDSQKPEKITIIHQWEEGQDRLTPQAPTRWPGWSQTIKQ